MRKWKDALKLHKQKILDAGYKEEQLLGIFLYGSQNYNMATEFSDIDTKAIYVPTLREMCLKNPVSSEIDMGNGEHCEIKDIRVMADMFKKQNVNFIEILFTEKCWVNATFRDVWNTHFYNNNETIARYDMSKCAYSISGQALHTLKQIKFDDPKVDGKKYSNVIRMLYFIGDFLYHNQNFWDSVRVKEPLRSILLDYKVNGYMVSMEEIDILTNEFQHILHSEFEGKNEIIGKLIDNGVVEIIKKGLEING